MALPVPLPNLNLNSRSGADSTLTGNAFGTGDFTTGGGLRLRHLPWYAWAAIGLVGVAIVKKVGR